MTDIPVTTVSSRREASPAGAATRMSGDSKPSVGLSEPSLVCPFTGKKIEIIFSSGTATYMAKGPFWNSKLYKDKQELLHDISHRMGVAPRFPRKVNIEIHDSVAPEPHPGADLRVVDVMPPDKE